MSRHYVLAGIAGIVSYELGFSVLSFISSALMISKWTHVEWITFIGMAVGALLALGAVIWPKRKGHSDHATFE